MGFWKSRSFVANQEKLPQKAEKLSQSTQVNVNINFNFISLILLFEQVFSDKNLVRLKSLFGQIIGFTPLKSNFNSICFYPFKHLFISWIFHFLPFIICFVFFSLCFTSSCLGLGWNPVTKVHLSHYANLTW